MGTTKEDLKHILDMINYYLPNFCASEQNLLKPTSAFTTSFYHHYLNELKNECQNIFPYIVLDDIMSMCNIEPERYLFLFINYALNAIGITYFNLNDFYKPSKRSLATIKFLLLFMGYFKTNFSIIKENIGKFNKTVDERKSADMEILLKKDQISNMLCEIGLNKEKLEQLIKEYDIELGLQSNIENEDLKLNTEIESLKKELTILTESIYSEHMNLDNITVKVNTLTDQLVSEDEYKLCLSNMTELEDKIKENNELASGYQDVLKNNHTQLKLYENYDSSVQQIDMSFLEKIEKVSLQQKLLENEKKANSNFDKEIKKQLEILEIERQDTNITIKDLQEERKKLEKMLKGNENEISNLNEKILLDVVLSDKLHKEYVDYKEALKNSKKENKRLEEEQITLKAAHQDFYHHMLAQLNSLTEIFDRSVEIKLSELK